jgi:hypothetical protein
MTTTGISHNDMITVTSLTKNAVVKSPLTIKGEARGNWYFEASFPVKLFDVNGEQLAINPAQAIQELGDNADKVTVNWSPSRQTVAFSQTGNPAGGEQRQILLIGMHQEVSDIRAIELHIEKEENMLRELKGKIDEVKTMIVDDPNHSK